ncbi:Abi family protein [Mammaliicoccus sciuri]|uniref:Abi family protein n=1 Tax=Mammaliicoccus sciuri TaxID=1296 RepID=UPI002B25999F|nr:Abi family protein [Mammaliicoccus sciuri]WQK62781.1 Abi family protein [Mammaliicoccus sciuri]
MRNIKSIKTLLATSIYKKPYLSCEEQLILLKDRGIKIDNEEFALEQLETISYYSLINAYTPLFIQKDGKYENDVTFNDFYMCYKYDTRLKNIIFKYIILIEQSLKTNLSAVIAKKYGVKEPDTKREFTNKKGRHIKGYEIRGSYLDAKNYDQNNSSRSGHLRHLAKYRDYLKNDSIHHYRNNHNHIPPWILIIPLNFGETIKWLSILKPNDKQEVLSNICTFKNNTQLKNVAIPIFEILRQYRNVIAHGQRFYSYKSNEDDAHLSRPFLNSLLKYEFLEKTKYKAGIGKNDIYALIISIMIFTKPSSIRKNLIEELNDLYLEIDEYCKYNLFNVIGITKDDLDKLWVLNRIIKVLQD